MSSRSPVWLLWERRLLLLLLYLLPLHEASKNIVWGLLVGSWLLRCLTRDGFPPLGRMGAMVGLWLAAGIWSSCFAIEPYSSWKGWWDMARGGLVFGVAADHLRDERFRITFLWNLLIATGIASCIAWWDYAWKIQALHEIGKPSGHVRVEVRSVGHFNQSGIFLAMAWMVALVVSLDRKIFHGSWLGRAATVAIGFALLGTTARFTILTCGVATFLILLFRRPPRWLFVFFAVAAVLALGAVASSASLRGRLFFQGSFHHRLTFWISAWDAVQPRLWTGVGLNNFRNIPLHTEDPSAVGTIDHAHNLYFNTLAQMGLPGMVALLGMLAAMGGVIWRHGREWGRGDGIFLSTAGVWFIIAGAGLSNTTLHHEMSVLFFLMMGLAQAAITDRRSASDI